MAAELKDMLFTQSRDTTQLPFKDHPQFPVLVDILCRKDHHHAILCANFSSRLHTTFFAALLQHLSHDHTPYALRNTALVHLNLESAWLEKEIERLHTTLNTHDRYTLVAISNSKNTDGRTLHRQLDTLLSHPKCRVLIITNTKQARQYQYLDDLFTFLHLADPSETDLLAVLKCQQQELEAFHHVTIPEELLPESFLLAERYLSTTDALEKALLLLDSSAARAGAAIEGHQADHLKPILTTTTLLNVLADWTQIPVSHLQMNPFRHTEFSRHLQQAIFGQDTAISILAHELLQARTHFQHKNGPYCGFLFAGAAHTGKKTTARILTEQLFNQPNTLYFAQPAISHTSLADLKLQRSQDNHFLKLTDIIQQTPYAIILFEQVEKLTGAVLEGIQEILNTGYLHDAAGNQYNFKQSILILSTTVGANSLSELAESVTPSEDLYTMDLMQLIMNEQKQDARQQAHHFSTHDIIEKIMPAITEALPLSLCQHLHLVPFLPLTKAAIERIIRLKLKVLGKQLNMRYGVELGYAPEVIRFLTNDVLLKRDPDNQSANPDKALKQLYFCVEQTITNPTDKPHHSTQLFLQLNETGHSLRCDWLAATTVRQDLRI